MLTFNHGCVSLHLLETPTWTQYLLTKTCERFSFSICFKKNDDLFVQSYIVYGGISHAINDKLEVIKDWIKYMCTLSMDEIKYQNCHDTCYRIVPIGAGKGKGKGNNNGLFPIENLTNQK